MGTGRLSAVGFSFMKDDSGYSLPFMFCSRGNETICLPATMERSFSQARHLFGRPTECILHIYIAKLDGKTYQYEYLNEVRLPHASVTNEQHAAYRAWYTNTIERHAREKQAREDAFQKFLHSDQLEAWLRAQPRCDDNKFLRGSPETRRVFLQWCFSQHGSPGGEARSYYMCEEYASALLERLSSIAARIRAENKAKYAKS